VPGGGLDASGRGVKCLGGKCTFVGGTGSVLKTHEGSGRHWNSGSEVRVILGGVGGRLRSDIPSGRKLRGVYI
jgi:hypothetical protein